jgi:5,10-methylene-tetrahydrofolate dehydrogenase/methenyl tetrahydrofolate cyclohydrolase
MTRLEKVGMDIDKLQLLLSFKAQGAVLVEVSMDDHRSLVAAVKQVDVVVSAMGGPHLLQQLKLVEAIKEAGNIQVGRSLLLTQADFDSDEYIWIQIP